MQFIYIVRAILLDIQASMRLTAEHCGKVWLIAVRWPLCGHAGNDENARVGQNAIIFFVCGPKFNKCWEILSWLHLFLKSLICFVSKTCDLKLLCRRNRTQNRQSISQRFRERDSAFWTTSFKSGSVCGKVKPAFEKRNRAKYTGLLCISTDGQNVHNFFSKAVGELVGSFLRKERPGGRPQDFFQGWAN